MIFKNEIIEQKWIKETSQTAKHGQTKVVVKVWKKNYMTVIDVKNEGQNDKNLENNDIIQRMLKMMETITERITDIETKK